MANGTRKKTKLWIIPLVVIIIFALLLIIGIFSDDTEELQTSTVKTSKSETAYHTLMTFFQENSESNRDSLTEDQVKKMKKYSEKNIEESFNVFFKNDFGTNDYSYFYEEPAETVKSLYKYTRACVQVYPENKKFKEIESKADLAVDLIKKADNLKKKIGSDDFKDDIITGNFYISYRITYGTDGTFVGDVKKSVSDYLSKGYNWVAFNADEDGNPGDKEYIIHTEEAFSDSGVHYLTICDSGEQMHTTDKQGFENDYEIYTAVETDNAEELQDAHDKYKSYTQDAFDIVTDIKNNVLGNADSNKKESSAAKSDNTDNSAAEDKRSDDKQKKDKGAEEEYDDGEADESGFHSVVEEYMIPLSDSEELDKDYVKNMSDHDLRIAINEMYARYGYHFKNKDLQDYFNSTSWYSDKGITDQSEIKDVMSELELYNLEILTDERNRRQ